MCTVFKLAKASSKLKKLPVDQRAPKLGQCLREQFISARVQRSTILFKMQQKVKRDLKINAP